MPEHRCAGSRCVVCPEGLSCGLFRLPFCLVAAAFLACLTACGSGPKNPPVSPGPPSGTQHFYTNGGTGTGRVLQFTLPLTGTSPAAILSNPTTNDVASLALDAAGNLASGDIAGNITIFNGPVTASASASAAFRNGTATEVDQLVFNSTGDLFATTNSNKINFFTHPLTSASTPSQVITSANLNSAFGAVLDSSNNLIVSNSPSAAGSNLLVFAPPYTGAPIATAVVPAAAFRQMAISGTQLFVVNSIVSTSQIDVYNLPITAGSLPAFSIRTGIFGGSVSASGLALDSSGNLYAGISGNLGTTDSGGVRIYGPPFSGTSAPSVTTGVFAFTMAIGK